VAAAHGAADQFGSVNVSAPIISIKGLHKWYSGVHALKGIDLEIQTGELVGLVGDNGAGKSTLIKVLSGVEAPDKGEIRVEGRLVEISSPKSAMQLGIETVYQYNSMVPTMTVARNLFIGREPLRLAAGGVGVMNQRKMREDSIKAIAEVDLHLRSPDTLVGELSGGQRQGVAIARAMYFKSKVLILDEPTNHLSVKETAKVLGFVKGLRAQNVTGILISHNLNHVFLSCERVITMARGRIVLDKKIHETSMEEIVAANDRVIPSFSQSRTVPTYAPGCSIGCGAV
jgi:simple sugar transport system ATP-binding protein